MTREDWLNVRARLQRRVHGWPCLHSVTTGKLQTVDGLQSKVMMGVGGGFTNVMDPQPFPVPNNPWPEPWFQDWDEERDPE